MFTHDSYKAAIAFLKGNRSHKGTVTWDAGQGWSAEAFWRHGRIVQVAINPDGWRIV